MKNLNAGGNSDRASQPNVLVLWAAPASSRRGRECRRNEPPGRHSPARIWFASRFFLRRLLRLLAVLLALCALRIGRFPPASLPGCRLCSLPVSSSWVAYGSRGDFPVQFDLNASALRLPTFRLILFCLLFSNRKMLTVALLRSSSLVTNGNLLACDLFGTFSSGDRFSLLCLRAVFGFLTRGLFGRLGGDLRPSTLANLPSGPNDLTARVAAFAQLNAALRNGSAEEKIPPPVSALANFPPERRAEKRGRKC